MLPYRKFSADNAWNPQLVRTIYLLRFLNDAALRQQARTQLSRGEARQDVAQRIFFADQGMFCSGDYYQMMNRASYLSLLSNAVLVYNTVRIARVLERANAQGRGFIHRVLHAGLPGQSAPLEHSCADEVVLGDGSPQWLPSEDHGNAKGTFHATPYDSHFPPRLALY